jgi:hypothetical protein
LDFIFRKIFRDNGAALTHVASQISKTIDGCDAVLKTQADQLRNALEDVNAMTAALTGYLMGASERPTEIYKIGLVSVRFLLAVGDLIIGWRLLAQAQVAHTALDAAPSAGDAAFYQGKIATADFFASHMLPNITVVRGIVETIDDDIMNVPEEAF